MIWNWAGGGMDFCNLLFGNGSGWKIEQLLNGKSRAPAWPVQLHGGVAENAGRLVALMHKKAEVKCGMEREETGCLFYIFLHK